MRLLEAWRQVREARIHSLPGKAGDRLRYAYWKPRLKHLGEGARISEGAFFLSPKDVSVEDGCWIDRNVLVLAGAPGRPRLTKVKELAGFPLGPGEVRIGRETHIAPNVVLSGHGGMAIGARCGIASNSTVYSFSHHYRSLLDPTDPRQFSFTPQTALENQSMILAPVWIEDDCAIGLNSTVLPGTWLKRGTWVASGTVVRGTHGPQATVGAKLDVADTPMGDLRYAADERRGQ